MQQFHMQSAGQEVYIPTYFPGFWSSRTKWSPSRRWQSFWAGLQTSIMWSLCSIWATPVGGEVISGTSLQAGATPRNYLQGQGNPCTVTNLVFSNTKRSPKRRKENQWSLPEDSWVPVTLGQPALDKQMTLYFLWIETTRNSHILPAAELPGFLGVGDREVFCQKQREKLYNFYCSGFFSQVRIVKKYCPREVEKRMSPKLWSLRGGNSSSNCSAVVVCDQEMVCHRGARRSSSRRGWTGRK